MFGELQKYLIFKTIIYSLKYYLFTLACNSICSNLAFSHCILIYSCFLCASFLLRKRCIISLIIPHLLSVNHIVIGFWIHYIITFHKLQQLKQFNIVKTIKNMPLHTKIQVSAGLLIVFTVADTHIFNGLQSMVWCVSEGTNYFCLV